MLYGSNPISVWVRSQLWALLSSEDVQEGHHGEPASNFDYTESISAKSTSQDLQAIDVLSSVHSHLTGAKR